MLVPRQSAFVKHKPSKKLIYFTLFYLLLKHVITLGTSLSHLNQYNYITLLF